MFSIKSLALISSFLLLTSASPIQKRSQITCKSYSPEEGKALQYKYQEKVDGTFGNAAFNGATDDQGRLTLVTLEADGSPAAPQQFRFWGCDGANSLDYPKGYTNTGAVYGQLRPVDHPDQCITISELKAKNAHYVSAPCLTEDDENLLTQYFLIGQNSLQINFLGNGNSVTYDNSTPPFPDEVYRTTVGETGQNQIRIDYLGENHDAPNGGVYLGFPAPN